MIEAGAGKLQPLLINLVLLQHSVPVDAQQMLSSICVRECNAQTFAATLIFPMSNSENKNKVHMQAKPVFISEITYTHPVSDYTSLQHKCAPTF